MTIETAIGHQNRDEQIIAGWERRFFHGSGECRSMPVDDSAPVKPPEPAARQPVVLTNAQRQLGRNSSAMLAGVRRAARERAKEAFLRNHAKAGTTPRVINPACDNYRPVKSGSQPVGAGSKQRFVCANCRRAERFHQVAS